MPMKSKQFKRAISFLLSSVLILTACSSQKSSINTIDDLKGKTVGTVLGWEADYVLSGRDDIKILRYDLCSDMVMALRFNKIDAASLDNFSSALVLSSTSGIVALDETLGECGYILIFNPQNEALRDDFNLFLDDYFKSEEYRGFLERRDSFDGEEYVDPGIKLTGTGRKLKVAFDDSSFPRAFTDMDTHEPLGFDLEALKLWANDRNITIEFTTTSFDDMYMGLANDKFDICVGYISDVLNEEIALKGFYSSKVFDVSPLYILVTDGSDVSVNAELD